MRSAPIAAALLLVACGAARAPEASDDDEAALTSFHGVSVEVDRSMPEVDAIGYELDLAVTDSTPGREAYRATSVGKFVATKSLGAVTLDFDGNAIESVRVAMGAGGLAPAPHARRGALLDVTLPRAARSGTAIAVEVTYKGSFAQADGANPDDFAAFGGLMVKQSNTEGRRIFASLGWPSKTRRFMPLRDHPRDGAMVTMRLAFPAAFTVLANGDRKNVETTGDLRTWQFEALTPMPPYDFHIAAYDRWVERHDDAASGVRVTSQMYGRDEQAGRTVTGDLPRALNHMEGIYGPYRFGKTASFIEVPIFGGGMEHASVVSLDETLFSAPRDARETAFHELAHHWSGNLVRIRTWNDFWLSEGFTDYLTTRIVNQLDGRVAAAKLRAEHLSEALAEDAAHPLRPGGRDAASAEVDVLTIFDSVSYKKGARTLRMLESIVGEAELSAFLAKWFARHAFSAVTTMDFEAELSRETGKDLKSFFDAFVYKTGVPTVDVTLGANAGGEQELIVTQSDTDAAFPLEVALSGPSNETLRVIVPVRGARTTHRVAVPFAPTRIVADPDDYLYGLTRCSALQACKSQTRCVREVCQP